MTWIPAAGARGSWMLSGGCRQLHAPDECLESWMPTERIHERIHVEIDEPAAAIVVRALHPVERAVRVTLADQDRRERDRRDVMASRDVRGQVVVNRLRLGTASRTRERVRQRRARVRA